MKEGRQPPTVEERIAEDKKKREELTNKYNYNFYYHRITSQSHKGHRKSQATQVKWYETSKDYMKQNASKLTIIFSSLAYRLMKSTVGN